MFEEVIIFSFLVAIFAILFIEVRRCYKFNTKDCMSFKEAMDLVELPIVTFYNNNNKLNFLLDTGSDLSHINDSVLSSLDYTKKHCTKSIISIGGETTSCDSCTMSISYKNKEYIDTFYVSDLNNAFNTIKKETGVQIHGILGSKFFTKYKYVLDFENLIAFSKK